MSSTTFNKSYISQVINTDIIPNHMFDFFYESVNLGDDCPVFDGLFEYCSISAGGSMGQL